MAGRAAQLVASGAFAPGEIALFTYTRSMAMDLRARVASMMPPEIGCSMCGGVPRDDGLTCGGCLGTGKEAVGRMLVSTLHGTAASLSAAALRGEIPGGDAVRALGITEGDAFVVVDDHDLHAIVKLAKRIVGRRVLVRDLTEYLQRGEGAGVGSPPQAEARRQLLARRAVTYDDLITMLRALAPSLGDLYPCVMLDERQDLAPVHWEIITRWAPRELMVVGDDAQAIFGFLGRRSSDGAVPRRPWAQHTLSMNFRSSKAVVRQANGIRLELYRSLACTPLVQPAASPDEGWAAFIDDEDDFAWAVADVVDQGIEPRDIAVLASTWDLVYEAAAAMRGIGLDVDVPVTSSGWKGLAGRAVIAMVRAAALGAFDEADLEALAAAMGWGNADDVTAESFRRRASLASILDERYATPGAPVWSSIAAAPSVIDVAQIVAGLGTPGAWGALPEAAETAGRLRGWAAGGDDSPSAFLAWLASPEAVSRVVGDGIRCQTIHAAKGGEWPYVFVYGASEGQIPPSWAKRPGDQAEWGRALYVAATRARVGQIMVTPRVVRGLDRERSRWLARRE